MTTFNFWYIEYILTPHLHTQLNIEIPNFNLKQSISMLQYWYTWLIDNYNERYLHISSFKSFNQRPLQMYTQVMEFKSKIPPPSFKTDNKYDLVLIMVYSEKSHSGAQLANFESKSKCKMCCAPI